MKLANVVDLMNVLLTERTIAVARYENRRWDADHRALKRAKVKARLRYRSFAKAAMASLVRGDLQTGGEP